MNNIINSSSFLLNTDQHSLNLPFNSDDNRVPDKDGNCPPCFNCLLPAFSCINYGQCSQFSGRCICPVGFGADDCSSPLCGSLAQDNSHRPPRSVNATTCDCSDGWQGVHCNVCKSDSACNTLMPPGMNGTCYRSPIAINKNHAICDVINPKILSLLKDQKPEVTISCNATGSTLPTTPQFTTNEIDHSRRARCGFQFWIGGTESFYCDLDQCQGSISSSNATSYDCNTVQCQCIPGKMLCGKDGSVDISEFLVHEVKGPGKLNCLPGDSRALHRECEFTEPAMDLLISDLLGDTSIQLKCNSGECLHVSQIPNNPISTPNPHGNAGSTVVFAVLTAACLFVVLTVVLAYLHNVWRANTHRPSISAHPLTQAELDALMADHVPATMTFSQIQYHIPPVSSKRGIPVPPSLTNLTSSSLPLPEYTQILHGIDGVVKPGEILAIMGGSGAGKTTCLDILARKGKSGHVSGSILVNGQSLDLHNFRQMCGYVDQEDTLMPTLTVEETILYSALLRLPKHMSYEAKCSRVKETMVELDILHIAKSRIGDSNFRGISGGEKKRVNIASELVTSPSILFLDEPTSGLDSYNAHNVIECVRNLARNYNRTIILSIHQPRSDIFAMFDQLLLLSRGHLIYSGPAQQAVDHFRDIGFECPIGYNIADYLIDITVGFNPSNSLTNIASMNARPLFENSNSHKLSAHAAHSASSAVTRGNVDVPTQNENEDPRLHLRSTHSSTTSLSSGPQSPFASHISRLATGFAESQAGENLQVALAQASKSCSSSPAVSNTNTPVHSTAPSPSVRVLLSPVPEHRSDEHTESHPLLDTPVTSPRLSRSERRKLQAMSAIRTPLSTQFRILADRTFKNLYRNPYLLLTHYAMAVIVAFLCGLLFWHVTADIAGFQNRVGCFFFVCALFGFSSLSSLQVFASERVLYTRERSNSYHSPVTYFAAKLVCDIFPLRVIPPILLGCIIYNMVGLVNSYLVFLKFLLVLVLFNVTAASLCLLISLSIPETAVASLIASLVMLFSMLFGGLLLNKESIPTGLGWLKHLSIFNFALEALVVNELKELQLFENKYGLQIEVPAAVILSTFGFNVQSYWADVYKLVGAASGCLFLAFIVLQVYVKERR